MLDSDVLEEIETKLSLEVDKSKTQLLTGGDINDVYRITTKKLENFVVKVNNKSDFPNMLALESEALNYFYDLEIDINYAKPICHGKTGNKQYLMLNYVEEGHTGLDSHKKLGQQLAEQHKVIHDNFGWYKDNYIGSLPQSNVFKDSWQEFYAENRLLFQVKMAFDNGYGDSSLLKKLERFCSKIDEVYPKELPALLHGDLWGGNYFFDKKGDPFLYDPAIYYGHREIDIAMTQLFGGFSPEFIESYQEIYPLEKGWEERIKFGQLYPNLVHVNLFGSAYLQSVESALKSF